VGKSKLPIKSFNDYITEEKGEMTFVFGRFNPPTTGHEKLFDTLKKVSRGGAYRVYASQSTDPKKNPLDFKTKVKFLRKIFPKYARNIMADAGVRHVMDICVKLYDQGYTTVNMVAGSDRVTEFEVLLNKYNGVEARHGFYQFKDRIKVTSAGERDPDSDDVSGMSASKLRAAAAAGDLELFSKGMPKGYREVTDLYNAVRKGMGLKESHNHRKHVKLEPVSEKREDFVAGELFKVGDQVVIKESEEVGEIVQLGANYLLVRLGEGKNVRKWIDAVEKLETEKECFSEVKQDPDIKDREGSQPAKYYAGDMAKSTKDKRAAHFKSKKSGPAPGDASAETKKSKHTIKFDKMFNEDNGLDAKAKKSGISKSILNKVYDRGLAAYKTGHRPGTTAPQWAMARVNSFITKGKGTWGGADQDLAKQVSEWSETEEACWSGYKQVGLKKKGNKEVPNCVPKEEVEFSSKYTTESKETPKLKKFNSGDFK
tara:strand:- start:510 stop:1961 length:1452 start_codon:yes stop_codon:yes gene_type:complete